MSGLLMLLGVLAFLVGLVSLIKPFGILRTRVSEVAVMLAGLLLLVIGASLLPATTVPRTAQQPPESPPATPTPEKRVAGSHEQYVYYDQASGIAVENFKIQQREYGDYLVGTAKNLSNQKYASVSIQFNVYDANGALIGNESASVENLAAGATWKFDALILQPNARTATIEGISAY